MSARRIAPTEGRKFDGGKPRYDLIPADALDELAALYALGAAKYGERNWEKGIAFGRIFGALMRHAWKWWRGETHDQEDGQHHLIAVAWGALCLHQLERTHPALDDRPAKDVAA